MLLLKTEEKEGSYETGLVKITRITFFLAHATLKYSDTTRGQSAIWLLHNLTCLRVIQLM